MNDIQRAFAEKFYLILGIGLAFGLLVGVVLFILAWKRGKKGLGIAALLVSTAGGVSPVIVIVLGAVFLFLILRNSVERTADEGEASAVATNGESE